MLREREERVFFCVFFFSSCKKWFVVCVLISLQRQKFWCAFVVVFFWLLFSFVLSRSFVLSLFFSLVRSFSLSLSLLLSFFLSFTCCRCSVLTRKEKNQNSQEKVLLSLSVCHYWNIFSTVLVSLIKRNNLNTLFARWWCCA